MKKEHVKQKTCAASLLYCACLFLPLTAFANTDGVMAGATTSINAVPQQATTIKGRVVDKSGQEVIGANIMEKGTTNGTISDLDGNFTLNVAPGKTLVVSYIGYKQQEVVAAANMTITLEEDSKLLTDVVVVGYGSAVKKDLTTSVTSVKSKDFLQGAVNDPMQMIDGKVAGLTMSNPNASNPNEDLSKAYQVRGASSLKAGNGPLIVIDGMAGGDLRSIAQSDIESITVLKDGSAAAIYGSRAANGVILIQTKQGKAGKVSIAYDGYIEHDEVAKKPDILSAEEFLAKGRAKDMGSRTDWYDELINKGNFGQNHNISMSGGSESSVFRISTNYREKEGIDIAAKRKEYGLRANFLQTTLDGILEVGGNIAYRVAEEDLTDMGNFKQAMKLNPTVSKDEMDYFKGRYDEYNPIKNVTERQWKQTREYITTDFNIKINITKDLNTEIKLARQGRNLRKREFYTSQHRESIDNSRAGRGRLESTMDVDWTAEWLGNYKFDIDRHSFKVMGGYSYQEFNHEWFMAENMDFPNDAFTFNRLQAGLWNKDKGRLGMESDKSKEKTIAFLGRVNYDFDNVFLVTASMRYEGNTKFGEDHKWGTFPAASAAWRFSRLSVFEDSPIVDDLKVRASFGVTGRSGFDRYIALAKYDGYGYQQDSNGNWIQVYGPGNNPNKDLSWEKQISYNFGLDYTLYNSRLSGSLDFFVREGKDVIADYDAPVPPFLHQQITTNVGTTTAKGIELQVTWDAIRTKDFSYTLNLTGAYTKSKLKSFSDGTYNKGYMDCPDGLPSPGNPGKPQRLADGIEIGEFFGYRYAGVDNEGRIQIYEKGDKNGNIKLANDGQDSDRTYIGNGSPKFDLALGNSFTYKNFDLSLFFRGRFDYQVLNTYQMYYGLVAEPEVNLLHSAYEENAQIKGNKVICDYFLEPGDYLKLDNITLGWSPKVNSKWISGLRLYGTVRNVFTITKYSGMDPTAVNTGGLWPGVGSLEVYPVARNFSFGVQISY